MVRSRKYKKQHLIFGYLFIAPTAAGLFLLNIYPAIQTVVLSFRRSMGFGNTAFAGLENYRRLLTDAEVWQSLLNTLFYVVLSVPAVIVLSLLTAVLMNQKIKGVSFYRTIYFLPVVAAPSAVAMLWRWLFNSEYGLINLILKKIGLPGVQWMTNPNIVITTIVIVGIWSAIGYNMILLLSGLQEIPVDYYESTSIDGANPIQQFFAITLPLVTPTLFFVVVTTIIGAFQVFDVIFMMIEPGTDAMLHTESLAYLFYKHAFILNDKGYGSAIVVLLLAIILALTGVQMKLQKLWVNY